MPRPHDSMPFTTPVPTLIAVAVALAVVAVPSSLAQPPEDLKDQVQRLIGQLRGEDPSVRGAAADALGELAPPEGDPETFAPANLALIEALQEEDADLREQVCVVLSMIASSVDDGAARRAVRALGETLPHGEPGTRRSAAQALARIEAEDEDPEKSAVDLDRAAVAGNLKQAQTTLAAWETWRKDLEQALDLENSPVSTVNRSRVRVSSDPSLWVL